MKEDDSQEAIERVLRNLHREKNKKSEKQRQNFKQKKKTSTRRVRRIEEMKFRQGKHYKQTTPSHAASRAQGIAASAQRLGKYAVTAKLKFGFGCGFAKRADRQTDRQRRKGGKGS